MQSRSCCLSLVGAALLLAGCPGPNESLPLATDDEQPPAAEPAKIEASLATWEEVEKTIASHAGKVVVVDLWSTTCAPCRREFPGLVKLHEEHAEDVASISVSLDYYGDETEPPESFRDPVETFLNEQNADFENFICNDVSDDVLSGIGASSVPVVLVYDQEGKLAKMFEDDGTYGDDGFTYEKHIAPLVVQLTESVD